MSRRKAGTDYEDGVNPVPVEPITKVDDAPTHGMGYETFRHPAFGVISASRISGRTNLAGSNVGHDGFMRVTIKLAEHNSSPYHDSWHGRQIVAELDLSESQWVALVSRTNVGDGTPCTLRTYQRAETVHFVPRLPDPESPVERLESTIKRMLNASADRGAKAKADILALLAPKLSGKALDEVKKALEVMEGHGQSTREFHQETLVSLKEQLVQESKVEIEAMVNAVTSKLGLASIEQLGRILAADPQAAMKLLSHDQGGEA